MFHGTVALCDEHVEDIEVVEPVLFNFGGRRSFFGPVVTLKVFEDDSLVARVLVEPGDGRVLVVDGGGSLRCALLGERLADVAHENGWAGVVVDGCVRDRVALAVVGIGIVARATTPRPSDRRGEGQQDVVVHLHGVPVHPGDWIYADEDGVVVARKQLV